MVTLDRWHLGLIKPESKAIIFMKFQHPVSSLALLLISSISFLAVGMERDLARTLQDDGAHTQRDQDSDYAKKCPSCSRSFDQEKKVGLAIQPCGHFLCKECLDDRWLIKNDGEAATCPSCQESISSSNLLAHVYKPGQHPQTKCSVCGDRFKQGCLIDRLSCKKHIFHFNCIHVVAGSEKSTCPDCRADHHEDEHLARQLQEEENRGVLRKNNQHRFERENRGGEQAEASSQFARSRLNALNDDFREKLEALRRSNSQFIQPHVGQPDSFVPQPSPVAADALSKSSFGLALELLTATAISSLMHRAWSHDSYTNREPGGIHIAGIAASVLTFFVAQTLLGKYHPTRYDNAGKTALCWALGTGLGGFVLPKIFKKKTNRKA